MLQLCQPDIRRYAHRSCMISDVDDAVQESLLVLVLVLARRVQSVRALAAFSGWLFKVVQRECRRLGRRALNYDPYDDERAEWWLVARDTAGLRADLVHALESLPADYRHVILLRDFEEMSMAEIAAALGLTVAAAKSRLHRARQMACEYLIG